MQTVLKIGGSILVVLMAVAAIVLGRRRATGRAHSK